jgi:hypothetical protein
MFSSTDVVMPFIMLVTGLMQFVLMAGAAFVGSLAALKWHDRHGR